MSDDQAAATETFVALRNLLFTVAYEILGSAVDAEDVLQETWLRWAKVDLDEVRDPRAYLIRITTRQALNRLRTLQRRREAYVGPWLPEPLLTAPDAAGDLELAESVSMAMMLVLETLWQHLRYEVEPAPTRARLYQDYHRHRADIAAGERSPGFSAADDHGPRTPPRPCDRAERLELLRFYARLRIAPDVDLDDLADRTDGFTAAELVEWVDAATFRARSRGATLRTHCPVTGFTRDTTGRITAVHTPRETIGVSTVVNAAGLGIAPQESLPRTGRRRRSCRRPFRPEWRISARDCPS